MNALTFQKKLLSMQENMMNFALMLTANREDAFDLTQDTTLKVLSNQEKFVECKLQRLGPYSNEKYIHQQLPQSGT